MTSVKRLADTTRKTFAPLAVTNASVSKLLDRFQSTCEVGGPEAESVRRELAEDGAEALAELRKAADALREGAAVLDRFQNLLWANGASDECQR